MVGAAGSDGVAHFCTRCCQRRASVSVSESPAAELGVCADPLALQEHCMLQWLSPLGRSGWPDGWRGAEEEEHCLLSVPCRPPQISQRKRAACWENYPAERPESPRSCPSHPRRVSPCG